LERTVIHHYLELNSTSSAHWAVGGNSYHNRILVQINDGHEEARIALTKEQAAEMVDKMLKQLDLAFVQNEQELPAKRKVKPRK